MEGIIFKILGGKEKKNEDMKLWMMTGTPASQSPMDAFGLAKLVCPDNVPRLSAAWKEKTMHQISRFQMDTKT